MPTPIQLRKAVLESPLKYRSLICCQQHAHIKIIAIKIHITCLTILVIALATGCSQKDASSSGGTAESTAQQDTVRKKLPLAFKAQVQLVTQGMFTFGSDMSPSPASRTHPNGSVSSLALDGVNIPLVSPAIQDGMITTKDFGQLEIFNGPDGIEFHGTDRQKKAIEQFVKKNATKK